ncbi:5'-nucleotidase [Faecalicoccus pleomorphus]|uniref:5'-nucleotidase n=1 Tax=Faecalicoccus pleomorphus TaxID=1323 RepID=A0AAW6CN40_9FIRM|nr:5'-nucleotidase [Faecalicoccus pleomorphus]MDB7978989.1 5'-nucleotidase [Faecalicoccus pleomorphus]MDB7981268.1 5'-nucleotidase [Faecalicoccus pleomorphus]
MAVSFDEYLVVGISSRALFNLEKENEVFEAQGLDAYREYQLSHEDEILEPGTGFTLVNNLLSINERTGKKLVEVIVMSRNSAETSLRIINSLDHYGLDINRMAMSGGENISRYLKAFGVDLFLSSNEFDVSDAINNGFAAGLVYNTDQIYRADNDQIRIAFDADAVLFSAESEKIFQEKGLDAFVKNEIENQDRALKKGPLAKFLLCLANLQQNTREYQLIRTAIVTSRDKNSGRRVLKTLRKWNIDVDEVFFLQGANKATILKSFGANIFFDDQDVHGLPASEVVPSARVPYKKGQEPK